MRLSRIDSGVALTAFVAVALLATGCGFEGDGATAPTEGTGTSSQAISNGYLTLPYPSRAVRISSGCTGTAISDRWILTAAHCLGPGKDPSKYTVAFQSETRPVTHIVVHHESAISEGDSDHDVDVALMRISSKFSNLPSGKPLIWTGDTTLLYGVEATCYGYGATATYGSCSSSSDCTTGDFCQWGVCMKPHTGTLVRRGTFKIKAHAGDQDLYFDLDVPNAAGQQVLPGDSGGACWMSGFPVILGTAKGGSVDPPRNTHISGEAFGSWASKRRDCPNFDPNNPTNGLCTEQCPCDVGEGDCHFTNQCRPGLVCKGGQAVKHGLPSFFDVCVRPASSTCSSFKSNAIEWDFCDKGNGCLCTVGEGDCDTDRDCGGSLVCRHNIGAAIGADRIVDLCSYPTPEGCSPYDVTKPNPNLCSPSCRCGLGEGNCKTSADCRRGLVCSQNVGWKFGLPWLYNVCVRPPKLEKVVAAPSPRPAKKQAPASSSAKTPASGTRSR